MLEYSSAAYKNTQIECKNRKIYTIDDEKTDVQCYIMAEKRKLHIIFRGTDSFKDWITDFQFWKKSIPYKDVNPEVKVHTGFLNAYKHRGVRDKIHKFIKKDIEKVTITGHSYGAALATLCAVDLEYNFPKKDYEVYLFGSPRVGNKAFRDSYNKRVFKTFRVNNGNDIVTKIPFGVMGYRHIGIAIDVGLPRIFGAFSFNAHKPSSYYINILKSYLI